MTDTNIEQPTGAQMVARYNALVERATQIGLEGYRPVARFMDRESADRRIAALESSIKARESGLMPDARSEDTFEMTSDDLRKQTPRPNKITEQPKHEDKPMKAKKTNGKAAKTVAKRSPRTNGHGDKTAEIGRLLTRKNGCTTADILAATGWKAVSVPAMAKACNLKLRKERAEGERTRYWGE